MIPPPFGAWTQHSLRPCAAPGRFADGTGAVGGRWRYWRDTNCAKSLLSDDLRQRDLQEVVG